MSFSFRKRCFRFETAVARDFTSMIPSAEPGSRPNTIFFRFMLGFLLVYTTWVWAGLRPSFHWAGVAAAGILAAGLLFGKPLPGARPVGRDPVLYLGLAFLALLFLQWLNAGRDQYFDVGYQRWTYTEPRRPGWPSAFYRADALQMLAWFFPAWTIVWTIRARIADRRELRGLLMLIAVNAGLLALFGVVQFASGTREIYWLHPLQGHFFASFAYGNHAAPFFVLAGALAAGLLYREMFDARRFHAGSPSAFRLRHPGRVAALAPALLLCLVGANLGFSRAGVILAWALGIFVAGYGFVLGWRLLPPAGRVNFVALALALAGSLYFAVAGWGARGIRNEFTLKTAAPDSLCSVRDRIDLELGGRPQFVRAALEIWREHPWFGVGGWGYKYLVAQHVPESYWDLLEKRGWANVHFDLLQFLAEFGAVGSALLLGALGVMLVEVFRACERLAALGTMGLAGLALVGVFSAIDLPFRCPAILYTWLAILAALPGACTGRHVRRTAPAAAHAFAPGMPCPERTGS